MVLIDWFLLNRFRSLLLEKTDDRSTLLLQQQVDRLRAQVGRVLDASPQLIQQQLSQLLGHVNERLRENAEVLHKMQQTLGERLDNTAQVVGGVQRSLRRLEEANRKIYEVGKDIASLQEILRGTKLRGGSGEFFWKICWRKFCRRAIVQRTTAFASAKKSTRSSSSVAHRFPWMQNSRWKISSGSWTHRWRRGRRECDDSWLPALRGISMRLQASTSCLTRELMSSRLCIFRR